MFGYFGCELHCHSFLRKISLYHNASVEYLLRSQPFLLSKDYASSYNVINFSNKYRIFVADLAEFGICNLLRFEVRLVVTFLRFISKVITRSCFFGQINNDYTLHISKATVMLILLSSSSCREDAYQLF